MSDPTAPAAAPTTPPPASTTTTVSLDQVVRLLTAMFPMIMGPGDLNLLSDAEAAELVAAYAVVAPGQTPTSEAPPAPV